MGQTIAEKIMSSHSGKYLKAGDVAICDIDFCFGQDGTSGLIIERLRELGICKPFDRSKFCMVLDHNSPSPDMMVSEVHSKMRGFAREVGTTVYEVGDGICHQLIPQEGHITCGQLVLGAEAHPCTYGAINVLSVGVGSTDLAITLVSGKNWLRVPETFKIIIKGKLPKCVYSKDVILHIIKDMGANGATYKSIEFYGEVLSPLSIDGRFTITNMVVEMGAKCGLMEADEKVLKWVAKHSRKKPKPVSADRDARYLQVREYDVTNLSPQVACPHSVDNVCSVEEVSQVKINEAFLGTCTNGRLEDIEIACKILKGNRIHPDVVFVVVPASREIYLEALRKGLIEILIEAGCVVSAPGCGPCVGTHNGVPANGDVVISTANRNFKGRMGNPNSFIYLASPATVAASAIRGFIDDPRNYRRRF